MQRNNGLRSAANMTILAGIISTHAGLAHAGSGFERFRFNNIGSVDGLDSPNNFTLTANVIGGFGLGFLDVGGGWTNPNQTSTFGREARVLITPPATSNAAPINLQLGGGDEVADGTMFKRSRLDLAGIDPVGTWTFQFFESFDDVPNLADMVWSSVTIDFTTDLLTASLEEMSIRTLANPAQAAGNNGEGSPTGFRSFLNGPNGFTPYVNNVGFNDVVWDAPENVYAVDWAGGDALFRLNAGFDPSANLDLFLYADAAGTQLRGQSATDQPIESIAIQNLPAGRYYLAIDAQRCEQARYELLVVPTPGSAVMALWAMGVATMRRRSRVQQSHHRVIAELKPAALAHSS